MQCEQEQDCEVWLSLSHKHIKGNTQITNINREVLGSDVDTSYLGEIQGIESLMLVPTLVSMRALTMQPACLSALSQSPAGPSRFDWPCDGFYCMISRYLICNALVFILVEISLHDSPRLHPPPYCRPLRPCVSPFIVVSVASRSLVRFMWFPL